MIVYRGLGISVRSIYLKPLSIPIHLLYSVSVTKIFAEFAKLLYCLDGYDDFNNLPQIYGIDKPIRLKYFDKINYLNKKKYKVLVGIIWIALAGYISQDIMKANIAYEYGVKILDEYLKENE